MAAPATATDFLELVRKSGVVDEKRFAELFHDDDLSVDPPRCAALLVRAGLLTQFQAQSLLVGRFRGFVLGPYKILLPLGQGGMGAVYLADHPALNRKVALKVLPQAKARDELALERFYREARAAAALDHPNIVRLFDINQGAGVHFLVMEYVEGTTLEALMAKTGPLHYAQAASYVAQAAVGLQHAHTRGLIHRDIKPSNLMLTKGGVIKILDMGLARSLVEEKDNLTERLGDTADVAGTADFIAPEQALGQTVDVRADVYSLGATFYTLMTGHPPFSGTTAQKLMQHQMREPPKLNKLRATVPPALVDVVEKMMAKQPRDRYQTAEDVIDALAPWLPAAGAGTLALGPGAFTDSGGSRSRVESGSKRTAAGARGDAEPRVWWKRPPVLAAAGAAAVLLVGALVFALGRGEDPPRGTGQAKSVGPAPQSGQPRSAPKSQPAPTPAPPNLPRGEFVRLSLKEVATARSDTVFLLPTDDPDRPNRNSVAFPDWEPKEYNGVPFQLLDPSGGAPNAIVLYSSNQPKTDVLPQSVSLSVNGPVAALHVLGGVSGWGWPCTKGRSGIGVPKGTPSVLVRIKYADGSEEEHVWRNGEHLADYNGRRDVPGSEYAFGLVHEHQCRYLAVRPKRAAAVRSVEFAKAPEDQLTCPVIFAVTVEKPTSARP